MLFLNEKFKRIGELANNLQEIRSHPNTQITVGTVEWITPFSILPLCAAAKSFNSKLIISDKVNNDYVSYLKTVQFPHGKGRYSYVKNSTYIPISRIDLPLQERELNQTVFEYVKLICSQSGNEHRDLLENALSYVFGELTANVYEHSQCKNVLDVCAILA